MGLWDTSLINISVIIISLVLDINKLFDFCALCTTLLSPVTVWLSGSSINILNHFPFSSFARTEFFAEKYINYYSIYYSKLYFLLKFNIVKHVRTTFRVKDICAIKINFRIFWYARMMFYFLENTILFTNSTLGENLDKKIIHIIIQCQKYTIFYN